MTAGVPISSAGRLDWLMSGRTVVIDNIGELVTNDPEVGKGELGVVKDVSVVIGDGQIIEVGKAGLVADDRIDAAGRCVLPGFVDSHTHLIFAGDRAEEFTHRMAGQPYDGSGIAYTMKLTRGASPGDLKTGLEGRLRELHRAGSTAVEIKSGYGLSVEHEALHVNLAADVTPEATFLGAHVVPPGSDADTYVQLVCGEMLDAAAHRARWVDVFCETNAFDPEQSRAVLEAGRQRNLGLRMHANQLDFGEAVQLGVELGCASVDHCTYLNDADIDALAASDTVATYLPAADFSTRQPYPDARRALDAGVKVAIASNCNPGSSYTTSMSFCIALAVREMYMTIDEAIQAATIGGARALRRPDLGHLKVGGKALLTILDAPSRHHLVYRPGVPLIWRTIGADYRLGDGEDC